MADTDGNDDPLAPEPLQRVLADGLPDAAPTGAEAMPGGETHEVYRITFADRPPVVAKYTTSRRGRPRLRRDRAALRYVAGETELPIPAVLAFGEEPTYAVLEACEGETTPVLSAFDPADSDVLEAAGRSLAALHASAGLDAAGRIEGTADGDLKVEQAASWPALYRELTAAKVDELGERFAGVGDAARTALADVGWLSVADPTLLHTDYGPNNVFRVDGRVTGVIDWEWCLAGDPAYDIVRGLSLFCRNADGDGPRERFLAGYRSRRELPPEFDRRAALYRPLLLLAGMTTFDQWADDATDDPDALAESMRDRFHELLSEASGCR